MIQNWMEFNDSTIPQILDRLDIKIQPGHLVDNETGTVVLCECCHEKIDIEDIGNIIPGSKHFYCRKLSCFTTYLVESL